jgi:hypothetical protein
MKTLPLLTALLLPGGAELFIETAGCNVSRSTGQAALAAGSGANAPVDVCGIIIPVDAAAFG